MCYTCLNDTHKKSRYSFREAEHSRHTQQRLQNQGGKADVRLSLAINYAAVSIFLRGRIYLFSNGPVLDSDKQDYLTKKFK